MLATCWYYAICYSSEVRLGLKFGVVVDFYPLWNGSRAILRRRDPYSVRVTEENELAAYRTAEAMGSRWSSDSSIQFTPRSRLCHWVCSIFAPPAGSRSGYSPFLQLFGRLAERKVGQNHRALLRPHFLQLSVIYDLRSRNRCCCFRFGRRQLCATPRRPHDPGCYFGGAVYWKAQIALPILLPIMGWALAKWHERKQFVIFLGALVGEGDHHCGKPRMDRRISSCAPCLLTLYPALACSSILGNRLGMCFLGYIIYGLRPDPLGYMGHLTCFFQAAFSVVVFDLIVPYPTYNAVVLLIPVVSAEDASGLIPSHDWVNQLTLAR